MELYIDCSIAIIYPLKKAVAARDYLTVMSVSCVIRTGAGRMGVSPRAD